MVRVVGENEQLIMRYKNKRLKFCMNDHIDILIEILKRLDGRSLSAAASVCRLWRSITRNDSLWEHLCLRHVSPPPHGVRSIVVALGGYKRLYTMCIMPALTRLGRKRAGSDSGWDWTRQEVELSLSLFCVEYYERLGSGGRLGGSAAASSLMFLCKVAE